jgi:hypothetical protein
VTAVPRPLSVALVELVAALAADASRRDDALALLQGLDAGGWRVDGYELLETIEGTRVRFRVPQAAPVTLLPPGLPHVRLAVGLRDAGGEPVLEVVDDAAGRWIEVRGLHLGFGVTPGLLRPLDPARAAVSVEVDAAVRIGRDWSLALRPAATVSLAPAEIAGTGIAVSLEDITFDLEARRARAGRGTLRILPSCTFAGARGLAVEAREISVGASGLSGSVRMFWAADHDGRTPAPSNPTAGHLLAPAWPLALESAQIDLVDNLPQRFFVSGVLRVPIVDAVLGLELGLAGDGGGLRSTVRIASQAAVDVPLPGGVLRLASLAVDGTLAEDAVTAQGALTGLQLTLGPIGISLGSAALALAHAAAHDELRATLGRLALGPLGTVDEVTLILAEDRDATAVRRHVRLEGTMSWADLRGRLTLPPGLPAPAGGRARAVLDWDDTGTGGARVTVRIAATVDDVGGPWDFLPAPYRPVIEEATLDVELVYPDAAAFGAASASDPLTGSASVSVVVRLPVLATLPGVVAVTTGDASGRVRGVLRTTMDAAGTPQVAIAVTDPLALDLALPGLPPAQAPVIRVELDAVEASAGDGPGRGTFALAGSAVTPAAAMDSYLAGMVARLGLPAPLATLLQRLRQAMPDQATFALAVQLDGASAVPSMDLAFRASHPATFRLLEQLGALVNPQQRAPQDARVLGGLGMPDDFFAVAPGEVRLSATLADPASIRLSGSLDTTVLGETFDMTIAVGLEAGEFEIALAAGTTDPILLTAPVPDPAALLGPADVTAIAAAYGLDTAQRQALAQLAQVFTDLAGELGPQGVFAFEVSDLGLRVTASGPAVSGTVRLVQLPRFLEMLTPLSELRLGLGAEIDKLFITIERAGGDAAGPLVTVPVPGDVDIAVYFRNFMLAYAWGRNEFAFALDAGIVPSRTLDLTVGGSGVYLPAATADIQLGATATAPPVPIPEGLLSFERPQRGPGDTAVDELGLQAVIGAGGQRFVTAYVRELAFSPTYFLLWPGFRADGGLVLGGPDPAAWPTADAFLEVRDWDRAAFFARFTVKRGTLIFLDPVIGVLLNPLAVIPPFITANPPYWVMPPTLMGDLYADEIGVSVNLPGFAFVDLTFERPLPALSLQAVLEFAALAASGFARPIPPGSSLREVLYVRLSVFLDVRLLGLSGAGTTVSMTLEANVADLINGAIEVMHRATATLEAGSDLVGDIERDPAALVRMIPRDARRLQHSITLGGFSFSGSLYLLTPEELHAELVLFFENRRRRPRGVAANQPPADPPATRPINQRPVFTDTRSVTRKAILDARSLVPDVAVVASRSVAAALAGQRSRAGTLERLKQDRGRNVTESAASIAGALATLPLGDAAGRKRTLAALGLPEAAAEVEAAIADLAGRRGPTDIRAVTARLRGVVVEVLTRRDEAVVGDSALPAPPDELAATIVARVISRPAPPPPRRPGTPGPIARWRLRTRGERTLEVDRLVPARGAVDPRPAIGAALDRLEHTLAANADVTADERAVADAEREIGRVLTEQFGVRRQKVATLHTLNADPAALTSAIRTVARTTWRITPRVTTRSVGIGIFDARHFGGVLRGVGGFVPRPPDTSDTVETAAGYQIQPRDGGGFSVPVPSAGAAYKVDADGGRYRLLVRQRDRSWAAHDLPRALVDSVPEGPGKADRLRDRLLIAPHTVRRPRTQAERDAVREQVDASDSLYLTSILARPEYQVKPSGGIHGPFYLADLLRNPSTGAYTVPSAPALLAGFTTRLFGSELRLAGMVVPGQPAPSAFLYGHSVVTYTLGALTLKAEGEFVASTGSLWSSVPLPSGATAAQDAVGFSGHVVLTHGTSTIVEGSASGEFTRAASGDVRASLGVRVASHGSVDLGVGDTEFARVAWSLEGDVDVRISPQGLAITVRTTASVSADLATYATRWVVDVPASTVCVPWYYVDSLVPPAGHWGTACTTTPEVGHPEIDFSTVHWQRLASARCAVRASVSGAGISFSLDLGPLGSAVTGTLGATSVPIPDLR